MPPELRLQPDRLRSHAIAAAGLSEDIRGVLPPSSAGAPGGQGLAAEHERLRAVLLGAVHELAELSAALAGAATAAVSADGAVASAIRRIQEELGAGRPGPPPSAEEGA